MRSRRGGCASILWTGSFVLYTGGASAVLLAGCYWLIDVSGWRRWSKPFIIFGSNPIVAYLLSTLLAKLMWLVRVRLPGARPLRLHKYIFLHVFLPVAQPPAASLLFSLTYVLLWLVLLTPLYRRRLFLRI